MGFVLTMRFLKFWAAISVLRSRYFLPSFSQRKKMSSTQAGLRGLLFY